MPNNASSGERMIPNDSQHDVVSFNILIEGNAINPGYQLMNVMVSKEVNILSSARLVLRDGTAATGNFEISESSDFIPGKKIEIQVGRDSHNETVFKGIVVKHSLKIKESGDSILIIDCKDESFKLTLGRKNRYFEKMKDSDAISQILSDAGLSNAVDATSVTHKEIVQFYCTDWDFMLSRADVNGLLVLVEDGKVNLKKPDTSTPSVLNLIFGENLREFESELDSRNQYGSVEAKSWDYKGQTVFEATSSSSGQFEENGNLSGRSLASTAGLSKLELRHGGQVSTEELKAWTDATMLRSRMSKIRGRGKIVGFSGVKPGVCVTLEGLGNRFNGKVYVTAVKHEIDAGTWLTHIQFGLSPDWFYTKPQVMEAPGSGLLPAVNGLQIGIVVQLQEDPDGEDRILIKLPLIDNQAKGTWARVATLDAGNQRGSFFRPEIGDEVIVAFINDDPRDAVVLGMLHSSAKPAPIPAKDENHIKGFVTRSKMKVLFDDDKKIITIETPAGNSMIISEDEKSITTKDQNSNEWKMSQDGISMKSPKDITIEAKGKISIKATQDISIEGMNATMKANTNLTLEGQAAAKLSASGQTTVKGAIVMIN